MSNKLRRFCIFCGRNPESKTREHVIPQWLINYTGDPNREISLGVDTKYLRETDKFKLKKISFKSFQFPACDKCNEEFSSSESDAKTIIEKVFAYDYLRNVEINLLLDWLDKVRIGLWLGSLLLDREIAPADPTFFIKDRIAEKDRGLFIYNVDNDEKGIQFIGFNSPAFQIAPCCFALRINNFYFFNFSTDYLFSRNIGFPYPKKTKFRKEDIGIIAEITSGKEKIKLPLVKGNFIIASVELYQPMFPTKLAISMEEDKDSNYISDYLKANCIDLNKGVGNIFYKSEGKLHKLDDETELQLDDKSIIYDSSHFSNKIAMQVLKMQYDLLAHLPSGEDLDKDAQKRILDRHKTFLNLQLSFMKLIQKATANIV
jgi:hypothetical protein